MEKVALFVDVQNVYYTVKQRYNRHFNYNIFWDVVTSGRKLIKAIAYATYKGDRKQTNFQNILRGIGFEVKLTEFIQRSDGSAKGDWDVGITLDIIEQAKNVDIIVLASGDGDFAPVLEKVIDKYNVAVEVYGVPGLTAISLINSASRFIPIEGDLCMPIPKTW